ncbi:MAG TPA: hypothetical protein DEO88_13085 [Syntrophobacteraceae bacterium]|nr:hypothetical protein [Syntrophobacteraceae bacterium]
MEGVAAVLHGAPITTFDLDVVHARTPDNITRLLLALDALEAHYRGRDDQRLRPSAEHLTSSGQQLPMTRLGPLDLPGTIGANRSYENLLGHVVELQVRGLRLPVLGLETLIAVKEVEGHAKDRATVLVLRRTLEEKLTI